MLSCLPRLFTPLPRSPEISPSILFHFLTTGVPQIATLGKSRSVDLISHPISVGSEAIKMATPTSSSYPDLSPSVIADPDLYCTLSTCPLSLATVEYRPSLAGNALYLALFGLFLAAQLFFGIRHRTWGFLVGMIGGNVLEVVGYAGRIQMYHDPFSDDAFRLYLVNLTLGPAFLAASIYLSLSRIIPIYSSSLSRFKPRTYTVLFITCDIISLLLQAAGGGIASASEEDDTVQMGIDIMIAGVAWQVVSLGAFGILCAEFAWKVKRASEEELSHKPDFVSLRRTRQFRLFLCALAIATLVVFVRSVFRCVELRQGFDGELANDEVTFMVLEGAMIVIAVALLTIWHPGRVFKGSWQDAAWSLRGKKSNKQEIVPTDGEKGQESGSGGGSGSGSETILATN